MERNGGAQRRLIQIQSTARGTCTEGKTVQESLWKFWKHHQRQQQRSQMPQPPQSYQSPKTVLHSLQPLILSLMTLTITTTLNIPPTPSSIIILQDPLPVLLCHFKTTVPPCFSTLLLALRITTLTAGSFFWYLKAVLLHTYIYIHTHNIALLYITSQQVLAAENKSNIYHVWFVQEIYIFSFFAKWTWCCFF